MAGQIVIEGFFNLRMPIALRALITRGAALGPALLLPLAMGEGGVDRLLVLSQVVIFHRWTDTQGVDAIADLGNSAVALAVVEIAKAKNKAALISSAGSTALTGKACSPVTVHWTWDSYSLAKSTVAPTVKAMNT